MTWSWGFKVSWGLSHSPGSHSECDPTVCNSPRRACSGSASSPRATCWTLLQMEHFERDKRHETLRGVRKHEPGVSRWGKNHPYCLCYSIMRSNAFCFCRMINYRLSVIMVNDDPTRSRFYMLRIDLRPTPRVSSSICALSCSHTDLRENYDHVSFFQHFRDE